MYEILIKILSESLLSLYPVFVKNIDLALDLQVWSRFFSYVIVAGFFIDYKYVYENVFSKNGMLLSLITLVHVYVSYRGFQLLESGLSYTLFYLYPIMILLMSGRAIHPIMAVSLLGVYLLTSGEAFSGVNVKGIEGIIMILIAALTEAFIYFVVRGMKTDNSWNHLFLSYFLGVFVMSFFVYDRFHEFLELGTANVLNISIAINVVIGLFGYLLRLYAIPRLDILTYSVLSYVGVVMAYIYGMIFNGDKITFEKVLGTVCIIIPNLYLSNTEI
jgi:drug/metabolite transporter (DMT)-like permease